MTIFFIRSQVLRSVPQTKQIQLKESSLLLKKGASHNRLKGET